MKEAILIVMLGGAIIGACAWVLTLDTTWVVMGIAALFASLGASGIVMALLMMYSSVPDPEEVE